MNRTKFLAATAFVCLAPSVQAQTIPRYNVEGYCQQVADVSGGSAMIFNGCMDIEQQLYNALKPVWAQISGKSRNYCDEVAQVSGGSYSILKGCMDMETNAANAPRSFDY
ncbi:hypothetical protein K7H22_09955 [Seohaeicola saemankumensis]|uniref:hypothetical protein n=1 Tax=Seohaeicola saemankumensis TaxID=481181 RepID=UPI001E29211D|nr:hypothetical protein [Seohaeicola saemankumensis]MCD1626314.1 hypothetical protein [Seohaeicola saemankumensis]